MRDKANGLARTVPKLQQFFIQPVAHDFVQRAKGFVHQQNVGIKGQRPRDAGALLHPARKLPGKLRAKAGQLHQVQHTFHPRFLFGPRKPHDLQRQPDVPRDRAPGIKAGGLKHIAIGPRQAGRVR